MFINQVGLISTSSSAYCRQSTARHRPLIFHATLTDCLICLVVLVPRDDNIE